MRRGLYIWMASLLFLSVTGTLRPRVAPAAEPTPAEILDDIDDLFRGESSHGAATMTVRTQNWSRSLKMEFWSQGKDQSLIRILEPKKERVTATLKSGRDLWNYLPKVKRVVKLPSSMMSASWMGSHFSNDDLVRESRMAVDYTFEKTFRGARDGVEILEITCTPKPDAPVVWGKVVVTVAREDVMPQSIRYYDEDMDLSRTMTYSEMKPLGGRTLPSRIEIHIGAIVNFGDRPNPGDPLGRGLQSEFGTFPNTLYLQPRWYF